MSDDDIDVLKPDTITKPKVEQMAPESECRRPIDRRRERRLRSGVGIGHHMRGGKRDPFEFVRALGNFDRRGSHLIAPRGAGFVGKREYQRHVQLR